VNEHDHPSPDDEDADLGALLRAAGPRPRAPAAMEADVRSSVEWEWRAMTAARERKARYIRWGAAAGVAVAALGVWIARPLYAPENGPVASVARIEGLVEYRGDRDDGWANLSADTRLHAGDELRTRPYGRVALQLASGVQLRLDSATRIAFEDVHHARMRRGGVYVDSGTRGADDSRAFVLDTSAGEVKHLGTQYQVRVANGVLRVGVREGLVSIGGSGAETVGRAGEQVTLQDGQVSRASLAGNDAAWSWIGSVTPPFSIEGRSVDEFLAWAARETGRQVVYESPAVTAQARDIVLKGSVAGLTPDTALTAVLSTTRLQPVVDDGHIRVQAAAP